MENEFLTREETAAHLKISKAMLDLLTKRGDLPVIKVGRRSIFDPRDIEEFINRSKVTK
jgi:predicted DNA-binding transcriptional regulator AlpA